MPSYSVIFLFYCLGDHQHLHSFPTRRSSDLARSRGRDVYCYFDNDVKVRAPLDAHSLMRKLDRKSTRLNSSHANSSYAGFCVKKKRRGATFAWRIRTVIRTTTSPALIR